MRFLKLCVESVPARGKRAGSSLQIPEALVNKEDLRLPEELGM